MLAVRRLAIGALLVSGLCRAAIQDSVKTADAAAGATSPPLPEASRLADATNAQGFLKIGYAHYAKGEYQEAIAPFKMALSFEPTHYEANLYLGYINGLSAENPTEACARATLEYINLSNPRFCGKCEAVPFASEKGAVHEKVR